MFVLVECQVENGLRPQEATVMVVDYYGEQQFVPLHRELLEWEGGKPYIAVPLIQIDRKSKAALVNLPIEADSGAHRIWVRLKDVKDLPQEARA